MDGASAWVELAAATTTQPGRLTLRRSAWTLRAGISASPGTSRPGGMEHATAPWLLFWEWSRRATSAPLMLMLMRMLLWAEKSHASFPHDDPPVSVSS